MFRQHVDGALSVGQKLDALHDLVFLFRKFIEKTYVHPRGILLAGCGRAYRAIQCTWAVIMFFGTWAANG